MSIVESMPDGRHRRSQRSRDAVLAACRRIMVGGDFRPSVEAVAQAAKLSRRTVFDHFGSVDALHLLAVDDADTRDAILNRMLGTHVYSCSPEAERAIVRAVVTGRV